ncbi:MAG: tetraacyldisaccharide 4'-kinase, partial [Pseudomonadota bacterium]
SWSGNTVHAIAGIGNPERFFTMLEALGIHIIRHPHSDHAQYCLDDMTFNDEYPLLMTEKDAVKCQGMNIDNAWYVSVNGMLSNQFISDLTDKLKEDDG